MVRTSANIISKKNLLEVEECWKRNHKKKIRIIEKKKYALNCI